MAIAFAGLGFVLVFGSYFAYQTIRLIVGQNVQLLKRDLTEERQKNIMLESRIFELEQRNLQLAKLTAHQVYHPETEFTDV